MTVIAAHKTEDGVFVFSDSALTHAGPPKTPRTAFGEHQEVDGRTVEELMPKVIELPRHVLSAFSGDVECAINFLRSTAKHLKHEHGRTEDIIRRRLADIPSHSPRFSAIFAYHEGKRCEVLLTDSTGSASLALEDHNPTITGSLPDAHRSLVLRVINVVLKNLKAPPEVSIAVTLTALQSMSINDILPSFGVGGTFFGAYVNKNGITWQQNMIYCIISPAIGTEVFNMTNCVFSCLDSRAAVVAAIDPPIVKRMELPRDFPGYSRRSQKAVTAKDIDRKSLVAKHFALLSVRDRKAVYVHSNATSSSGPVEVRRQANGRGVTIKVSQAMLDYFEEPSENDTLKMEVLYPNGGGIQRGATMIVPLDTPHGISVVPLQSHRPLR